MKKEERHAGKALGTINNQIKRYFEMHCSTPEISGMQGRILHFLLLNFKDEAVAPKVIEKNFTIRRATSSKYLMRLEQAGMIERVSDESDARLKQIKVTQKAKDLHPLIQKDIERFESILTKGLSQRQLEDFFETIEKMSKNLDA